MQQLKDFIVLKALYNKELGSAVEKKDKNGIMRVINRDYEEELNDGTVKSGNVDVDWLYTEYVEALEDL